MNKRNKRMKWKYKPGFEKWLLLCIAVLTVFMQGGEKVLASNLIPNPEITGKIVIHRYQIPEGTEEGDAGTGAEVPTANLPEGAKPLQGVKYRVLRVEDNTTLPGNANAHEGEGAYNMTIETGENGTATFEGLPHGVYLVTEISSSVTAEPIKPFLVRIPMTNPTGDGLLYTVNIYPKNVVAEETVSIEKYVNEVEDTFATAKIGDDITWYLVASVPEDMAQSLQYDIIDEIHEAMDYVPDSVTMTVYNRKGEPNGLTPGENAHFQVSLNERALTISLNQSGRTIAAEALDHGDESANKEPYLLVTLKTKLNDKAQDLLGYEISNGANLYYRNGLNVIYDPQTAVNPTVATGGINIVKTSTNAEEFLNGASFLIYDDEDEARNGGTAVTEPGTTTPWEITTAGSGQARFAGLAYDTYWIVESKAPRDSEGNYYNLMQEPEKVTIDASTPAPVITIQNTINGPGFTLPATGGSGTLWLTLTGIIIIAIAAGVLWLLLRRKEKE